MTARTVETGEDAKSAEATLLARWRGGDPLAFEELLRIHRNGVHALARRLLGRDDRAEDATQETLLRAWKAAPRFRGDASFRTWILRIALNVSRTAAARIPREVGWEAVSEPSSGGGGADAGIALAEARRRVREAVSGLPPRQREAIVLKVYSDLTYEQVASILGVTVGAAKAHVHQATANLRRRLEEGRR
jgi:RNA polymerase sigma-70 factor (ECF subfamily)